MPAETLKLTPTETIEVVSHSPEALEVRVSYPDAGKAPPKHFHPAQDERFEVLEGKLRTVIDGTERDYGAGETIEIPRGVVHQMWNEAGPPVTAVWRTTPAGRTLEWFRAIDAVNRKGDRPNPLDLIALLPSFEDTFRLAVGPAPVVRAAVRAIAPAARVLRGSKG